MAVIIFITGLCIGSFLNVVIYRVPIGISVVVPPSRCAICEKNIPPYDLLPVISWLLLRGRCRHCGAAISWRYPAVELLTGLIFVWAFLASGYPASLTDIACLVLLMVLACVLISISFIDLDHGIIPFSILAAGEVPAFVCALFSLHVPLLDALAGAFAGGGIIFAIDLLSRMLYKRPGMGGGDVMLMFTSGLFLGLSLNMLSLFFGIILGGVYAIFLLLSKKAKMESIFPFGPFLAAGIWVSALYGDKLVRWYLSMVFI